MTEPLVMGAVDAMGESDLAAFFDSLSDQELSGRVASGGLTHEALAVASTELRRRGLAVPAILPPEQPVDETYLGDMVILERGLGSTEAHVVCDFLRSVGIVADAGDTNTVQAYSLITVALGGASVRVPESQLAEAREVMAAYRRGEFSLVEGSDPDGPES